jgi:hypothetical protein
LIRESLTPFLGDPSVRRNPSFWEWAKGSKLLAIVWTAMRVWLGVEWIKAGAAKLWGDESAGFMHNGEAQG